MTPERVPSQGYDGYASATYETRFQEHILRENT